MESGYTRRHRNFLVDGGGAVEWRQGAYYSLHLILVPHPFQEQQVRF